MTINKFGSITLIGFVFLMLWGCQKSFRVLNHTEIKSAYTRHDFRYLPSLKEVVGKEDRDLAADAMLQLGNFYRDLALKKKEDWNQQEAEVFSDLEEFFISNSSQDFDFNLKNVIYRNLVYSSNPQIWEIYADLFSPSQADEWYRENRAALLFFLGERMKWLGDRDFSMISSLCQKGLENEDFGVFVAGLDCLDRIVRYQPQHADSVLAVLEENKIKFSEADELRHYRIITHPLWIKRMENLEVQ